MELKLKFSVLTWVQVYYFKMHTLASSTLLWLVEIVEHPWKKKKGSSLVYSHQCMTTHKIFPLDLHYHFQTIWLVMLLKDT
jgi:hypothetical protein